VTTRSQLSNRRAAVFVDTTFQGLNYTISYGLFPGRRAVAELFISCEKNTSAQEAMARDAAILISQALQYGTPFSVIHDAVTRAGDGAAASIVGHALDVVAAEMS